MLDVDVKRFTADGLNQTPWGLRLALAVNEGQIAVKQIAHLTRLGGPGVRKAVESWRHAYIKASNAAAVAIDGLWNAHQWPTDGARDRRYEWRPSAGFKR